MTQQYEFDAIVVGSGISGGWAAKELTQAGLKTLVLEAGGPVDPAKDFVEHVQPYEVPFRGWGDRTPLKRERPIQTDCYPCDELGHKFFVNDLENPYTHPDEAPFSWFRGRQVGGRSITWGRQVYRWSDLDFEANAKDGHGNDWPIRYKDIAPWYCACGAIHRRIGRPRGTCAAARRRVPGAHADDRRRARRARTDPEVLQWRTRHDHRTRGRSHGRSQRPRSLPLLRSLRPRLHHPLLLQQRRHDPSGRQRDGKSHAVSQQHRRRTDLRRRSAAASAACESSTRIPCATPSTQARVVFLCASAIESVRLLLNSKSAHFPDGLANSSGLLGRYVMDHHYGSGAFGKHEWVSRTDAPSGAARTASTSRVFATSRAQHPDFLRGYGMQGGSSRTDWHRGTTMPGYGADFKKSLITGLGPWTLSAAGWGETLPHPDNRVSIDPHVKDKWGVPAARIDVRWRENERAMQRDMMTGAAEMLDAAGCTDITLQPVDHPPGHCIHEMGGARMSVTRDRRRPQCLESGLGRAQSFHHGWRVHGEHRLPESQHYLHGIDRACLRLRGRPNAAQRALKTQRRDFLLATGLALGTLALPRSARTAAHRAGLSARSACSCIRYAKPCRAISTAR